MLRDIDIGRLLTHAQAIESRVQAAVATYDGAALEPLLVDIYRFSNPPLRMEGWVSFPYPHRTQLHFTLRFAVAEGEVRKSGTCGYELVRDGQHLVVVDSCQHHDFGTEYHKRELLSADGYVHRKDPQPCETPTMESVSADIREIWLPRIAAAVTRGDLK